MGKNKSLLKLQFFLDKNIESAIIFRVIYLCILNIKTNFNKQI